MVDDVHSEFDVKLYSYLSHQNSVQCVFENNGIVLI